MSGKGLKAVDSGVAAMQGSGRGQGLIEGAEHHREDHGEGAMKATNRVVNCLRVFGDGRRDPRVSQLEQEGATGAKEC